MIFKKRIDKGMDIPYLMPHQLEAFNGDQFVEREILRLKDCFGIGTAIETGTCFGATTAFLARHFERVISIEIDARNLEIAKARLTGHRNVYTYLGATESILGRVLESQAPYSSTPLFYLDAHWGPHCPLADELRLIAGQGLRPVLAIHNVQVPGQPGLAFDSYGGQPFTFTWLRIWLDAIYGPNGYDHYFNTEENSMAVRVGMLFVTPKTVMAALPPFVAERKSKMQLFVNYYHDSYPGRQQEINECLSRHIENTQIDKIFAIIDTPEIDFYGLDQNDKLEKIVFSGRPTFEDLFGLARRRLNEDDISIFANSDIYLEDLLLVRNYLQRDCCFVLSRWDRGEDGALRHFNREDSQDCWIFRGPLRPIPACAFRMGMPACDNAIAYRIQQAGYRLHNPSQSIKAVHLHNSGIRWYNDKDPAQIITPPYLRVPTSPVEDLPLINWVTSPPTLPANECTEDILIDYIFTHIGRNNRYSLELFADDGRCVEPDKIPGHLAKQGVPAAPDLLKLDLRSNDFWVLKKILQSYAPRCICTRYNGTLDPVLSVTLKYEEGYTWDMTNKYGFSFGAGRKLMAEHGYRIVFNSRNQFLISVREELMRDLLFNVSATRDPYHPESPNAVWEAY
jgi:hypothetical protein